MKFFFMAIRWMLGIGCGYLFFRLMARALEIGGYGAAGYLLFGFAALIASVLLISAETVKRFCEWAGQTFAALIYPDEKFSKPKLSYVLARHYSKQMRHIEAIEEYRKIIRYYPNEREAYLELMSVCNVSGHVKVSKAYMKRFQKKFPGEAPPPLGRQRSDF